LAAEIAVGEPVCHYGGCHELRPKSTRSGVVWEEVSVEGKLIIAETYLNHLEVNIFVLLLAPFRWLATTCSS
jgi:hypothetical protein